MFGLCWLPGGCGLALGSGTECGVVEPTAGVGALADGAGLGDSEHSVGSACEDADVEGLPD